MLLIGTMNWSSTRMRGMFHCPTCDSSQNFRLKSSRPFLTLYFIPVLPIGGLEEFVECRNCRESFEPIVLANRMLPNETPQAANNAAEEEPSFQHDLLKVIALVMIEDGHVTENEISVARRMFQNISEENLSREELGAVCSQVRLHRLSTNSFLATAAKRRSHEEKLLMLQAMFGIAGADGELTPRRMKSLVQSQETLGIEEQEFERAIESTEQWLV